MYEDDTVFVVGAGASAEFGLPVGWKLLEKIRDNSYFQFDGGQSPSKGNRRIYETVHGKYMRDPKNLTKAFMTFGDINRGVETAGSIDEYINRYSDDPLIAELGKIQIAHAILEAEGKSNLIPSGGKESDGINWANAQNTWISNFARVLFDGVRANEINRIGEGITIICFNYDRCIEHYLEHAIQRGYRGIDGETARKIVANMEIIHPYGSLGPLSQLAYGKPLANADLYRVAENLITWSESVEDRTVIERMKSSIAHAQNIVFLGFAFANQNMELLDAELTQGKPHYTNVYSTGFGLTSAIDAKLKNKIVSLYASGSDAADLACVEVAYGMTCNEFMTKHLLNFSA